MVRKALDEAGRIAKVNSMKNTEFLCWSGEYVGTRTRLLVRCTSCGLERDTSLNNIVNNARGCPNCSKKRRWTKQEREAQLSSISGISFVGFAEEYAGHKTRAWMRCDVDGFEWCTTIDTLINQGSGCPQCAGKRRWTMDEREDQINSIDGLSFIRWGDQYKNAHSRAVVSCEIDGYEWMATPDALINKGTRCPMCAGLVKASMEDLNDKISSIGKFELIGVVGRFSGLGSKVKVRCNEDGFEWDVLAQNIIRGNSGCPKCANHGFDTSKVGFVYLLRSYGGDIAKVGISNDMHRRLKEIYSRTPFQCEIFDFIECDGATARAIEKRIHSMTEQASFDFSFDGYTEWRCNFNFVKELFSNEKNSIEASAPS